MSEEGIIKDYESKYGNMCSIIYSYLASTEKDRTKALEWMINAYRVGSKYYGPESASTLEYLFDVGEYAYKEGKIEKGIVLMKSAINQMEEFGIDIPIHMKTTFAGLFCELGEYDKSITVVRDYLKKNKHLPLNKYLDAQVYLSFLYLQSKTDTINWLGLVKHIDRLQRIGRFNYVTIILARNRLILCNRPVIIFGIMAFCQK